MNEQTTLPMPDWFSPNSCLRMKPQGIIIDRAEYRLLIAARWHGSCLRDAARNLNAFAEIHDALVDAMRSFRRDPFQLDIHDKCLNAEGTLSAYLWKLQETLQPDKSCLHPLLEFNEPSQTVFLRRGLIAYCTLILRAMGAKKSP